jgi:hypothetical protein
MGVLTIEGIVDHGQIKLISDVQLPEQMRVYVVVPDMKIDSPAHLFSPRLRNSNQPMDFEMEVVKEHSDASS